MIIRFLKEFSVILLLYSLIRLALTFSDQSRTMDWHLFFTEQAPFGAALAAGLALVRLFKKGPVRP